MKKLVLRIIPDVKETVYRDIEIGGEQTLEQLHQIIVKAFELDGDQMASFFETNEFWEQIREIPLMKISDEEAEIMSEVKVSQMLLEEDDKLLYIYDFLLFRQFFVELMSMEEAEDVKKLPKVIKRFGDSPKISNSDKNAADAESILLDALLGEDFSKDMDEFEEEGDEDDWEDFDEDEYGRY